MLRQIIAALPERQAAVRLNQILRGTNFSLRRARPPNAGYVIRDDRSGAVVARPSTIGEIVAWLEPAKSS